MLCEWVIGYVCEWVGVGLVLGGVRRLSESLCGGTDDVSDGSRDEVDILRMCDREPYERTLLVSETCDIDASSRRSEAG